MPRTARYRIAGCLRLLRGSCSKPDFDSLVARHWCEGAAPGELPPRSVFGKAIALPPPFYPLPEIQTQTDVLS